MIFYPPAAKLATALQGGEAYGVQYLPQYLQACQEGAVWPVELLLGIGWRESRFGRCLTPPGPAGTGDHGNGLGLNQIDKRYHRAWAALTGDGTTPLWADPLGNCRMALTVLTASRDHSPDLFLKAWVAGYNADPDAVRKAVNAGKDADTVTTGQNYAADVISHAIKWHLAAKNGDPCDCVLCGVVLV